MKPRQAVRSETQTASPTIQAVFGGQIASAPSGIAHKESTDDEKQIGKSNESG